MSEEQMQGEKKCPLLKILLITSLSLAGRVVVFTIFSILLLPEDIMDRENWRTARTIGYIASTLSFLLFPILAVLLVMMVQQAKASQKAGQETAERLARIESQLSGQGDDLRVLAEVACLSVPHHRMM